MEQANPKRFLTALLAEGMEMIGGFHPLIIPLRAMLKPFRIWAKEIFSLKAFGGRFLFWVVKIFRKNNLFTNDLIFLLREQVKFAFIVP